MLLFTISNTFNRMDVKTFRSSSSSGNTSIVHSAPHNLLEMVSIATVSAIVSLFTIVGNVLVLLSFKVNGQLKTVNNYYLLSLAFADLIIGLFSMNLYTTYILMGYWSLGNLACDLWLAVDYVASNASVMNLLVISFDRYFSITRPLTYRAKRTPRRAGIMIGLAWLISLILWAPPILCWQYFVGERTVPVDQCQVQFFSEPVITFGTAIAAFYIPVSIMTILYCRIYKETEKRTKDLAELQGDKFRDNSPNNEETQKPSCFRFNSRRTRSQGSWSSSNQSNMTKATQAEDAWPKSDLAPGFNSYTSSEDEDRPVSEEPKTQDDLCYEAGYEDGPYFANCKQKKKKCISYKFKPVLKELTAQTGSGDANKESKPCSSQTPSASPLTRPMDANLKNQITKRKRMVLIKEKKAAQTLSAILLAFIITWTPYNIMVLISTFCSNCIPLSLWHLGYWLCYVNSTVNPVCYALCNKTFQKTFRMLLSCKWMRNRGKEKVMHWSGRTPQQPVK